MSSDLLAKYQDIVQKPPAAGDILTTNDGSPAVLTIQVEEKKPPFIYGRAFFSEVLDESIGWYLRGTNDERSVGWKCVLMTKARKDALINCEIVDGDKITVKSLKVVRISATGHSLLCEVHEYLPKADPVSDPVPDDAPKILVADVNEVLNMSNEELAS